MVSFQFLGDLLISMVCRLCILVMPCLLLAQSDQASFQHLNIENGLSNNAVNSIVQDDNGYIWIATDDGLNKFNGYTSKVFYPNSVDSSGNVKTLVGCSFKDSKGRLWFGADGLILCNPSKEIFSIFKNISGNIRSIPSNDVFSIVEDENSVIWIGTRSGLARYNEATNDFTRFLNDTVGNSYDVYCRNRIIDMISDRSGNLWMTMLCGLHQFSLSNHTFTPFLLNPEQKISRLANQSKYLCFDQCGRIWIQYYDYGIFHFDIYSKKYSKLILPDEEMNRATLRVNAMACDSKNNIWIASSFDGLLYFSAASNSWKHYKHDIFNSKSIAQDKLHCFYEDRSGLMWIGTSSKGVDRLQMGDEKFINFVLQPGKLNSLCGDDISCFHEDANSNLWIGSKNGLMHYDRLQNKFKCFRHDSKNMNSISDNYIYSIDMDTLNNLWIATENGLNYFNPKSNNWTRYIYNEANLNGIPSRVIFDVKIRKNGELWLATSEFICRFNQKSGIFENRRNTAAIENLPHAFYVTIFEDSQQEMWVSTAKSGIYKVDNQFKLIKTYRKSGGFQANMVHQFTEDPWGNLWMASDMGIYYKKRMDDTVYKLRSTEAVLNGDIKSIVLAGEGKFWVSTSKGLVSLVIDRNFKLLSFRIFTDKDGLQSNAFNAFAGIRLKSGELCFGGINGFNIFNPATMKFNTYIPPVQISNFKIQDREIPFAAYSSTGASLSLNYDQNSFSFEMAALNYNEPALNQFGYQLQGYDDAFIYQGTNRFGQYTNVAPGKYLLKILGSNNDSLWNKTGYSLNLTISPPYWKTLWFRVIVLLLIGFMGTALYSQKVKTIQKKAQEKAEVDKLIAESRSVALRAQMNPHFIFNSLNSIQYLISESAKEEAHKYLSKFSKLMRLVLENSGKTFNTIAAESEMLNLYLEMESLRFTNKFTYTIEIGTEPGLADMSIPSMLLHPFVENAVIHGLLNKPKPGHLKISMNRQSDSLICLIEDDGIGRIEAERIKNNKMMLHNSLGLKVSEARMKMIELITNKKAQIKIEDLVNSEGNAAGTRVVIELPIDIGS